MVGAHYMHFFRVSVVYIRKKLYLCRRLSNGKTFSVSGQPFQVPSQKFTIFKILTQFSSQPFSGLVKKNRPFCVPLIARSSLGHRSVELLPNSPVIYQLFINYLSIQLSPSDRSYRSQPIESVVFLVELQHPVG